MKLEAWEREPLWLKLITPYLKRKRFPYLEDEPEIGKWVRIAAPGCVAANGEPVYADFRKGTENKLIIFFQGGGVSWNAYTAARPSSIYQKNIEDSYYMIHVDLFTDIGVNKGILSDQAENPFRNWSKLVMPYSTGDFHCGTGDFPYTALDGSARECRHHGYTNFHTVMDKVTALVPDPDALLVCGCSGGGFGAALLCDSILDRYPKCENVTCLVDSGFFPMEGWHQIAENVWHAPKAISERIHSDNITLDALQALRKERGEKVKLLLSSSPRDGSLARMINLVRHGTFAFSKESGEAFEVWLKDMLAEVKHTIPDAGIFIFDLPDKGQKDKALTTHCMIADKEALTYQADGKTCAAWIMDAVNGRVETYGQNLLK